MYEICCDETKKSNSVTFDDFLLVFLDSSCKKFCLSNVESDVYIVTMQSRYNIIDLQNAKNNLDK